MASLVHLAFLWYCHGGVCSKAYLRWIEQHDVESFWVYKSHNGGVGPKWCNNIQYMGAGIVYRHVVSEDKDLHNNLSVTLNPMYLATESYKCLEQLDYVNHTRPF